MTKTICIVGTLLTLSGCHSFPGYCSLERADLVSENARLMADKIQIERYMAGQPIPREVESVAGRDRLLAALVDSYNKAVGRLESRAAVFNRNCAS